MTYEEIDERYHDAAVGDDGEGWEDGESGSEAWDDPELATDDELDADAEEEDV